MTKTAVILMGIQASGKSTFCKTYLQNLVRINLDTLRTRCRERQLLEDCFEKGLSFAVDNTNPTKQDRERYISAAKQHGYEIIGCFFQSKVQDCIARNRQRRGAAQVPDMAIAATSNKLELPSLEEGFDKLYFVGLNETEFLIEEWRN